MARSLYSRLALVLFALLLVAGVVGLVQTLVTTRRHQEEVEQRLNRQLAANLLKEKVVFEDGQVHRENLEEIFHILMVINPRIEVYLLDPEGGILAFSAAEGVVKAQRVDLAPVRAFLAGGRIPLRGDDPRNPGRRKVFSAAPIDSGQGPEGYLYIVLGSEIYESVADMLRGSYILRLSAWTAAGALIVTLALGLLLFRLLTGRLERLDRRIRAYRAKRLDLAESRPESTGDEIERLGDSFERLQARIERQVLEIERADEMRRELVANVSHDLRTPLASLQGYLETVLLKGDDLGVDDRRHYLEIAYRQSEKLGKLVSELFELAKLESGDLEVKRERFSLAELAQDVAEKFRLPATQRSVQLAARLPRDLPFVEGDIGLIERVLDNLLDNALRHTPEGGQVLIVLEPRPDGAEVRVTDTGTGIPETQIPRIFERFVRGEDAARSGGGSGLGLAIARRIVELHGSSIAVESAVGRGSTFSFRLARA